MKNNLFYMEKIALQNTVNFLRDAEIYGERTELRGKFRKNQNFDIENSSLLQCKVMSLYYMCLEGFSLRMIFLTVTVELNFSAS